MRALLLALLLLPALPSVRARADDGDEDSPVQRYLVSLQLGDNIEEVRRVYPPADEWPSTETRGVTRYRVTRELAKAFPPKVETLYVGFKRGRLVEIEIVYDEKKSRLATTNKLAGEYSLLYGEPRRSGNRFWWSDGKTVLRVFHADVPIPGEGKNAVAWRTAVQVFDEGLFNAAD